MRTIPLLPCASIEEIAEFAEPLGFSVTYRQQKPNPYLALDRDGLELHYFGMAGFRPEDSYGSCVVVVENTKALFEEFAAGLRAEYGQLPMTGYPRITRPRRRKNADNHTGFSLIDPSGNWIRVIADRPDTDASTHGGTRQFGSGAPESRLASAYANAVVLADSHGDVAQARKILAGALARAGDEPAADRHEAEEFLAELRARE